jgi:hypothetical protein
MCDFSPNIAMAKTAKNITRPPIYNRSSLLQPIVLDAFATARMRLTLDAIR